MSRPEWQWTGPTLFTFVVVLLVAIAAGEGFSIFNLVVIGVAFAGVAFFHRMFPGSQVFGIALANALAVYACLFVFISRTNFPQVDPSVLHFFFVMPFLAFLAGTVRRKDEIHAIVLQKTLPDERKVGRGVRWLIPVFAITVLTFFVPALELNKGMAVAVFAVSMTVTSVLVFFASPGVSTFLIDTGVLFDDLLARIRHLAAPAFAFLTFYSLNVIIFACIYQIIDSFTATHMFFIDRVLRPLTFTDSLYFSIISLSTVGYGDITPANDVVRVIVAVQVVFGVLLLLFGFSEILSYSRERRMRIAREED